MPSEKLDAIDRKILSALQENARLTNVELAEKVGLSPSPCLRRVKVLEKEGIIEGYRATLNRQKIGLGLTVFVGVKVERHQAQEATEFRQAVSLLHQVVSCHLVSGDTDFLLQVVVPSLKDYEDFLLNSLLNLPGVKDIRSNFVIQTVKSKETLDLSHIGSPH